MKYITTPIYYPNAKPHLGTAYTTILCDIIARYNRLYKEDVVFLTGLDEHGQKIQKAAIDNNMTEMQWVDLKNRDFVELWDKLKIKYDDYIRTTEKRHIDVVNKIVLKMIENDDIYLGEYTGKYCISEETFVTESDLVDGKYMGKEVIDLTEKTYFFKLSKYADRLLQYYEDMPEYIIPKQRKNELIAFINQGLQDLSITRTTFDWGIPMPNDKEHVIYVWIDALSNYLTVAQYGDDVNFKLRWTDAEVVHFLGKDILRFHAIILPAMLMSLGVKVSDKIFSHGWWTVEGEKMSKSLGNVINPTEEVDKYGVDAFRYYLVKEAPIDKDSDYSKDLVISRINSDLANDLGNLVNRTMGMQKKYFGDIVYKGNEIGKLEEEIERVYNQTYTDVKKYVDSYNYSQIIKTIWAYISRMNKYIDESTPWILYKENKTEKLKTVMFTLFDSIYKIAYLVSPILVESSQKILDQIGISENVFDCNLTEFRNGTKINEPIVLFPRIEVEKSEFNENIKIQNPIDIEEFDKINISVVQIEKVQKVENSDKLLKFIINTGSEKRQILSGIAKYYQDYETLKGKKVLAILNLEPRKIMNEVSQGMLLTYYEKKNLRLIELSSDAKLGDKIK